MTCIKTGHITTMEQQKARSQKRFWAARWSVLRTFYRQILSLLYIVLFSSETSAPARPGTTCIIYYTYTYTYNIIHTYNTHKMYTYTDTVAINLTRGSAVGFTMQFYFFVIICVLLCDLMIFQSRSRSMVHGLLGAW